MAYNPRHPKIHNTGISAIVESISEAHRNAQAQRTSNTGSHFIPSGNVDENGKPDGTGSIIGSGANGGGIAPWVNDTTPPGVPTGITVTSQASMILVTWDGTLQGGIPDDFDHISVEIDGVEAIKMSAKGTYPSDDSYVPGSMHDVRARAYDNAHDVNGQPKPNVSGYSPAVTVKIVGAAATEEVNKAQQAAQQAIDKATGAATAADSASNTAKEAKNTADGLNKDVQNAVNTATNAESTAQKASTNADKASNNADKALSNAKDAINQSTAANAKADKALNNGSELVRNPAMDPAVGDLDGFGIAMDTGDAPSAPPQPYSHYAAIKQRDYFSTWQFPLAKNRIYRFGAWVIADKADRKDLRIGWRYTNPGTHWDECFTVHAKDALSWTWVDGYAKTPNTWDDKPNSMVAWLNVNGYYSDAQGWWLTGLTIKDVTEAQGAQLTADGKNRTFASKTEPPHTGLAKGDVWYQVDDNGNTVGMKIWDGTKFNPNLLFADGIFVPGSVGPVSIQNGAITAEKIFASEALLDKILVRKLSADDIDVGSLSAAIIKSYKFVTSDGRTGFDETGFWSKDANGNEAFRANSDGVTLAGVFKTNSDEHSRFVISQEEGQTPVGERSLGLIRYFSSINPKEAILGINAWDNQDTKQLTLGPDLPNVDKYPVGTLHLQGISNAGDDSTSASLEAQYIKLGIATSDDPITRISVTNSTAPFVGAGSVNISAKNQINAEGGNFNLNTNDVSLRGVTLPVSGIATGGYSHHQNAWEMSFKNATTRYGSLKFKTGGNPTAQYGVQGLEIPVSGYWMISGSVNVTAPANTQLSLGVYDPETNRIDSYWDGFILDSSTSSNGWLTVPIPANIMYLKKGQAIMWRGNAGLGVGQGANYIIANLMPY